MPVQFAISAREKAKLRNGLLLASPWIIGLIVFYIYPIAASFYYSFTEYKVLTPAEWIGLRNYITLIREDPLFRLSLYNTLYYVALEVPLSILVSICLALALNTKVIGTSIYRTIYFLPTLVPSVASAVLWMWVLNPQYGLINSVLYKLGINGPGWIADPKWSKPSIILMQVWGGVGRPIVIYLASLQDIPQQLYEAAEIDGANVWAKIRWITLPMLTPVILFNTVMGLIGAFQMFTQPFIMTDGGPANSTLFYTLYLYRNAFRYFKMGYASAMAWILFLLIFLLTVLIFRSSSRWVYYAVQR
jgi:multiple sugar transport system permease protein